MSLPATPVTVRSPADLTPEWLTDRLTESGRLDDGGTVASFAVSPIGTGQMSESFRVRLDYPAGGPQGPGSVVLKVAAVDEGSRATGAGMGAYAREVRFYRELAPTLRGPLAACLHAVVDEPTGWFTLLLEDLAPAEQGDQIAGCSLEEAAGAVDALAALQGSRWDEDALTATDWLTTDSPLNQGLLTYLLPLFEERYAGRVSEEHLQVIRRFVASADAWSAHSPRPHALAHCDFRLDNMLFGARDDGRPVVVDWQTLSYGPALLDLSYFLGGSLAVEDRRAGEERLVRRYHEGLLAGGVTNLDWDTCWSEYRRQVFHGIVMAVAASMLVQRTERGDDMFMTVLARHCQQALDLGSLDLLPEAGDAADGPPPLRPDPADEGHHAPGGENLWNESWYFDFTTTPDGIAGYTRIGLYPNRDEAWITLALVHAGRPSAMLVDLRVPLPAEGTLAVTGGEGSDLTGDHVCLEPLGRFAVTCSGTGELHADPAAVLRGERGEPVPVAMDLTWETAGEPYQYRMLTRYEIPCRVSGTVRIGDETFPVDGLGQRDHSWGARDWWAADWCWSAGALDDGTRFQAVEARIPGMPRLGMGYAQGSGGAPMTDLRTVAVEEEVADGLVVSGRLRLSPPDLDLAATALAHGPLLLVADDGRVAHFPRSLFRVDAGDGRTGLAWIEWNRNQGDA